MADIIDNGEIDRDTVDLDTLEQQFSKKVKLLTETAVSLKKSYINKLDGTKSLKLAVSLSNNSIEVYELSDTSLSRVAKLSGHQKALTEVVFSPEEDHLVYSTGQDGVIKLWDTRNSGTCAQEYTGEEEEVSKQFECMDVSCNGRVLCAGSQVVEDDAYMVFWDHRSNKPLGGYWNSHTDDITQVKFHKEKTEILSSGSLDGLLNIYNILEPNEDDALTYSLNVENSVEKLTWLSGSQVACVTQSDDLQIWDADSGDMTKSFGRDKVARSIRRSKEDDCYLVDVYTPADNEPVLVAGSNGGNGEVLRSVTISDKKLQPRSAFARNKQTVRCCWHDQTRDILITAGESGLISVWGGAGAEAAPADSQRLASSLHRLHGNRHKPY